MKAYFISYENLSNLFSVISNAYQLFVPVKINEKRYITPYQPGTGYTIGEVRTVEPLKAFFFPGRTIVALNYEDSLPDVKKKPYCIAGVKACDLYGCDILDRVFRSEDYTDPFYKQAREETLIISSDCTMAIDTCYCTVFGRNPYPESGYDLNLSPLAKGYLCETGSEKGKNIIEKNSSFFEESDDALLIERSKQREKVKASVEELVNRNTIPDSSEFNGIIERNYNAGIWQDEAKKCVECGACNTICPTCHCFLLYDQKKEETTARFRTWDSCLLKNFARVAGGSNPRASRWMRLRNRFEKKFDYFPAVFNEYACTGCGRCISACPAKIDIRTVLKRLVEHV
ncbi:MAG: 4Fe-4S dicluster domain-containing protein [Spirochaetales bacterium]|nr:4Fe-4S dicluster domain-containing protein [Spirochaetales bacterium]